MSRVTGKQRGDEMPHRPPVGSARIADVRASKPANRTMSRTATPTLQK